MTNKQFYYKKHIKGYVNTWEVGEYWCYEKGKPAPFLVTAKGYAEKVVDLLNEQQATIKQLQRKCFELEKDYLIETSDISDKIYLEDEIKKLKKEYGVIDDE